MNIYYKILKSCYNDGLQTNVIEGELDTMSVMSEQSTLSLMVTKMTCIEFRYEILVGEVPPPHGRLPCRSLPMSHPPHNTHTNIGNWHGVD